MHVPALSLLLPIVPNRPCDGVVLRNVRLEGNSWLHFDFEDDTALATPFEVRLTQARARQRCLAAAGPFRLTLDAAGEPSSHIVKFARNLAGIIARNSRRQSPEQLSALFDDVNPYVRRIGAIPKDKRVDLRVGHMCNERCVFCTDIDGRGRELFQPAAAWNQKLREMREQGAEQVLFVGNEPTLRADLPEMIACAKALGYVDIELSTNGVRLSDRGYLQELLDAGMNTLSLSVHGFDEQSEGINTGRPDLVKRRRQALENFAMLVGDHAAQTARGVFLTSVTIFTRHNLAHIPKIIDYLDGYHCMLMKLYYPWISGAAAQGFSEVVPSYPEILGALEPIRDRLEDPYQVVRVANLPPCVPKGWASSRTSVKRIVMPSLPPEPNAARLTPQFRNSTMDPTLVHAPECATCALNQTCSGVSSLYLAHYGSAGLAPILA